MLDLLIAQADLMDDLPPGVVKLVILLTLLSQIGLQVWTKLDAAKAAKEAKAQRAEVKTTLEATTAVADQKLEDIKTVADTTHSLVNGRLGDQLRLTATIARRLSDMIPHDAAARGAAELAEMAVQDHERNHDKSEA